MTKKETALGVVGAIGIIFMAITIFVILPILNENWIDHELTQLFEKFGGITTKAHPNKIERESLFAKVLRDKAVIVKNNTLPLVTCKARFIAQNPGTIHRRDVKEVFCSWGS